MEKINQQTKTNKPTNQQTKTMAMLPDNYQIPAASGNYIKLVPGDTKLRILCPPIMGEEGWRDKPGGGSEVVRVPWGEKLPAGLRDIKHFWATVAWDFGDSQIKIWSIGQKTIQFELVGLIRNVEWGDLTLYNITVGRQGSLRDDTKYKITPSPRSEAPPEALAALKANPVNLEALFSGEDPFASVKEEMPF